MPAKRRRNPGLIEQGQRPRPQGQRSRPEESLLHGSIAGIGAIALATAALVAAAGLVALVVSLLY